LRQKKVRRLIEYEGPVADVEEALSRALLSAQREIGPGDVVPGVGPIHSADDAPKVTLRLIAETETTLGQGPIWKERPRTQPG